MFQPQKKCIFYRLSVRIREKISSHRLHQMRMRCECWIAGEHNMVCSYVIRTEPGWTSLRVFKCRAGYLSSVSEILLLRAQLALVNLRSNFTLYLRLRRYVMATSGAPPSTGVRYFQRPARNFDGNNASRHER